MRSYLVLLFLFLAACGGGNGGSSPPMLVDTTPPVITLVGDNPQIVITGNAYVELGATARDNVDGNIDASIVVDASAVNPLAVGEYAVTYDVTDAAGNPALTVTRTVRVQHPPGPDVSVSGDVKTLIFDWTESEGAEFYRLLEQPDSTVPSFDQIGTDIPAGTLTAKHMIAVHLFDWIETRYLIEACNSFGCNKSDAVAVDEVMLGTIGYFKASNTEDPDSPICVSHLSDYFGSSVALSTDGHTMAVGAPGEDSNATGIDGDQDDDSSCNSGAAYVFRFDGESWSQQAYIKASNTGGGFGGSVALSADGDTLAVSAPSEASAATGINGDQADTSMSGAGAVYLFRFDGDSWAQQAYIKAPVTDSHDGFGDAVALSADGNTLAVGAASEDSSATGINGDPVNDFAITAGAAYLFRFDDSGWSQQAYIKASNTGTSDNFGESLALSADGNTLVVGAHGEDSSATGINGDQGNTSVWNTNQGAAYLFRFDGDSWAQEAYIKASNTSEDDQFGKSVAISGDGNMVAVGAPSVGNSAGALYLFGFDGDTWAQLANVSSPFPGSFDHFGQSIGLNADGSMIVVGASGESSSATGINGDPFDDTADGAGAAYLYRFNHTNGTLWMAAYIKASNTERGDTFGGVNINGDGKTLAISAVGEDSIATGINGDQADNSTDYAGAVYVY